MLHLWERGEVWWEGQRERPLGRSTRPRQDYILKWIIMKWNEETETGLIWFRIQTGSG